jgi:hypothetical protein
LVNLDPSSIPDYSVDVDSKTKFIGNGLVSNIAQQTTTFGPYFLNGLGQPGASVIQGPDSIFRSTFLIASTQNITPFSGSGTVPVTFSNKALTGVNGSNNFSLQINTNSDVTFRISYYFCNAANLPVFFEDLQVKKDGNNAILDWNTRSESAGMAFRVEASDDGEHFQSLGTVQGKGLALSKYEYVEPLHTTVGKRYYRITMLDPDGGSTPSMIRTLSWGTVTSGMSVYPNPAGRMFTIHFGQPIVHSTQWQLINMEGQLLEMHVMLPEKTSDIQVNLNRSYPAGTYIIKTISPDGKTDGLCRIMLAD